MIKGIDVVFLHVQNPELLAKWYQEVLGLQITFHTPNKNWIEFTFKEKQQPTRFALDFPGKTPSEIEKQPIMISFKVEDIELAVQRLEKKGVKFIGKNKYTDVGKSLVATFQDPEGNYLQLSEKKKYC